MDAETALEMALLIGLLAGVIYLACQIEKAPNDPPWSDECHGLTLEDAQELADYIREQKKRDAIPDHASVYPCENSDGDIVYHFQRAVQPGCWEAVLICTPADGSAPKFRVQTGTGPVHIVEEAEAVKWVFRKGEWEVTDV